MADTHCYVRKNGSDGVWHDDPECWSQAEPEGYPDGCDCPDEGVAHGRAWKHGNPTKPCRELVRVRLTYPRGLLAQVALQRLNCDVCGVRFDVWPEDVDVDSAPLTIADELRHVAAARP